MRVLVFAPHPDDDVIGCGGSIIKHLQKGNKVMIIYMTSGDAGGLAPKENLAAIREEEAGRCAKDIGVNDLTFLRNPDGYLEYGKDNLVTVINIIREKKPDIVYLPHKLDAHKDHVSTSEIVLEAIERANSPWFQECTGDPWLVRIILGYEVWTPLQQFSYVENITDVIEKKINALREHKSQIDGTGIRYDEAIRGLNRYRGVMTRKGEYCECFQILKMEEI